MKWKWTIFNADLNPTIGAEQKGIRPVLVISDEYYNELMPVVSVLPLTSLKKGRLVYPNEVLISEGTAGVKYDCIIMIHQIRTISKQRLVKEIGSIENGEIQLKIIEAFKIHFNL